MTEQKIELSPKAQAFLMDIHLKDLFKFILHYFEN